MNGVGYLPQQIREKARGSLDAPFWNEVAHEIEELRAERKNLLNCRKELREVTEAMDDPTINLTRTLLEAVRELVALAGTHGDSND